MIKFLTFAIFFIFSICSLASNSYEREYELLKEGFCADFLIISKIDGREFPCHKLIISNNEFFRNAINSGMKDSNKISLDYSNKTIEAIIAGIYKVKSYQDFLQKMTGLELIELGCAFHFLNENNLLTDVENRLKEMNISSDLIEQLFIHRDIFSSRIFDHIVDKISKKDLSVDFDLSEKIFAYYKNFSSETLKKIAREIIFSSEENKMKLAQFISSNISDEKVKGILNNLQIMIFPGAKHFFKIIYSNTNDQEHLFFYFTKKIIMPQRISGISINRSGDRLIGFYKDNKSPPLSILYNIEDNEAKKITEFKGVCAFSLDGKKLINISQDKIYLHKTKNGKVIFESYNSNLEYLISYISPSLNHDKFYFIKKDGTIIVFYLEERKIIKFVEENLSDIFRQHLIFIRKENEIQIIDISQNKKMGCSLPKHSYDYIGANSSCSIIVTGYYDELKIWKPI